MKRYLPLAAVLILTLASVSFAQVATASPSPAPKPKPRISKAQLLKKLSAAETKLWDAWKNKDAKPFNASLSPDSIMVGENGTAVKDVLVKEITTMPCEVKSFTLSDWKLTMLNPDAALLTYKGSADGTCAGAAIPTTWASSVWVNRRGKWWAAFHQETPVATPK